MKEQQAELVSRVRAMLTDEPEVREVSMFGGRSFMVNEKMVVSVFGNGDLLVRIARERDAELIALPGVTRPEMGAGRSMGPGWVLVEAGAIDDEEHLSFWMDVSLEYNQSAAWKPAERRRP